MEVILREIQKNAEIHFDKNHYLYATLTKSTYRGSDARGKTLSVSIEEISGNNHYSERNG